MKNFKIVLTAILGLAIAGIATTASAQNTKQGFATAVRIEGNVTYSLGQGQPEYPLVAGKFLPPGAIIFTKDNGVADLVLGKTVDLPQAKWSPDRISPAPDAAVRGYVSYKPTADQNAIRLTPNSTLAIDKLTIVDTGADAVSDTELDLKKGKIFASVRKLSGASQYIVKLPNGVAGVRGTLFSISVDGAVACFESTGGGVILALTLTDGTSKTFVIAPGYIMDPATGQPANISPQLQRVLHDVFQALRTTYFQVVNYEFDHTTCFISPTSGH
ncbi:MAG: FecR family protein [Verrucomicrobiae bacterium]|nr:FecR family protein [Verrucomicrobiae bacterium]